MKNMKGENVESSWISNQVCGFAVELHRVQDLSSRNSGVNIVWSLTSGVVLSTSSI